MSLKEKAESMGIKVDGRWKDDRIQEEIDKIPSKPEIVTDEVGTIEPEPEPEPEGLELNKDGFSAGKSVSSEDLLRYMAEQRQKTGTVPKASKPPKQKRKKQSKVHAQALDKG